MELSGGSRDRVSSVLRSPLKGILTATYRLQADFAEDYKMSIVVKFTLLEFGKGE